VLWGAYHGFSDTRQAVSQTPHSRDFRGRRHGFTFLAVIIGWVLFRAPDARSAVAYYAAMINPFAQPHDLVLVTSDLYLTMAVGLAICFLPGLGGFERLHQRLRTGGQWQTISMASAAGLLVLSIAKATTVVFHPVSIAGPSRWD
jgi:hypothetical protein